MYPSDSQNDAQIGSAGPCGSFWPVNLKSIHKTALEMKICAVGKSNVYY